MKRRKKLTVGNNNRHSPGDIVAYRRRPRKGEIFCHNHVVHTSDMPHGTNGFRWFCVKLPARRWQVCPCGWRPDLGVHYAIAGHVQWTRRLRKKLGGSQQAFDRHVAKIA
jgi:hypothetical protein